MTTFEKCKLIRKGILTRCGENLSYKKWNNEFKVKHLDEMLHFKLGGIDPTDLSLKEMIDLDFGKWDEENPMMLIPIWLFPFLCDEFECESISGSKHSKLSELDNDNRFGLLGYGVIPKPVSEIRNEKLENLGI